MGNWTIKCLICSAALLGLCTVVLVAVAVSTDWWQEFRVDRTQLSATVRNSSMYNVTLGRYTHSRHRGLIRECYPGTDTKFLDIATDKVDGYCFNLEYDVPLEDTLWSDDKMLRIHLMRCVAAFFALSGLFFVIAYIAGLCVCCKQKRSVAFCAGLVAYFAAFFVAGAMAFWHGAEYLEKNKITGAYYAYQSWDAEIRRATRRQFHWSYYCGWIGMVFAAITASLWFVVGCMLKDDRYEDQEYLDKGQRGAYPGPPYPMSPVYAVEDPYAYNYPAQPVVYARPQPVPTRGGYMYYDDGQPAIAADGQQWGWKVVA